MNNSEAHPTRRSAGFFIAVNGLLSWTILPLVLPPFRLYTGPELLEVLLWQAMGLVGWPLGLVGGLANLLIRRAWTDLVTLLSLSIYPTMFLLLLVALYPKRPRPWALVLLHLFLTGSFAMVWYGVLNGYDFMNG